MIFGKRVTRQNADAIIEAGVPKFEPGMSLYNAAGDVTDASTGYDYAIRTSTYLAAKSVKQLFYEVQGGIGAFVPVIEGEGAFFEDTRVNREFYMMENFEDARISTMASNSKIAGVSSATAPLTIVFSTFAAGANWNMLELEKAMRALNWDVQASRYTALKKFFDLGVQKLTFLGSKDDSTNTTGLLTMANVNSNTSTITSRVSNLSAADFQTFVGQIVSDFRTNCNQTIWPNRFVMPESDYVGMARAASDSFPVGPSKLEYLTSAFKAMCGSDFQVLPLAYANKERNGGYVFGSFGGNGKNRYALYRHDPEILRVYHPVPYTLVPAVPVGAMNMETAAYQQVSGAVAINPLGTLYFDWA